MKNSKAEATRWLRQAENDLAAARLVLQGGFFAQACFMAHQVAEKALKALAYFRGDRFVIGHSLVELASTLEDSYPRLRDLQRLLTTLDRYYLPTRYPDALPGGVPFETFQRDEAQEAVDGAARVVACAQEVVQK